MRLETTGWPRVVVAGSAPQHTDECAGYCGARPPTRVSRPAPSRCGPTNSAAGIRVKRSWSRSPRLGTDRAGSWNGIGTATGSLASRNRDLPVLPDRTTGTESPSAGVSKDLSTRKTSSLSRLKLNQGNQPKEPTEKEDLASDINPALRACEQMAERPPVSRQSESTATPFQAISSQTLSRHALRGDHQPIKR